jgi:hypothetical protein
VKEITYKQLIKSLRSRSPSHARGIVNGTWAIGGPPNSGKTSAIRRLETSCKGETLRRSVGGEIFEDADWILHTDWFKERDWDSQPMLIASKILERGSVLVEGVQTLRVYRKVFKETGKRIFEKIFWMTKPYVKLCGRQEGMVKGLYTIMDSLSGIDPEFDKRVVRVLTGADDEENAKLIAGAMDKEFDATT